MRRLKRRIFSGSVCEQIVFSVGDRTANIKIAQPKPRFQTEEDRKAHKVQISKRRHAQRFNANFDAGSLYSTLTFDDDWEVHTFQEAKRIRSNYLRTLKKAYPDAVIFLYMGRGKGTHRIHFHMISDGIPEDVIVKKWKYGTIHRVEPLREHNYYDGVDHGQDYTGLANYLFGHWTEEQGGHRWLMTKNAKKPEREETTEIVRNYSVQKPPRAPKGYILVEAKDNKYGYLYFKYVKKPPQHKRHRKTRPPEPVS